MHFEEPARPAGRTRAPRPLPSQLRPGVRVPWSPGRVPAAAACSPILALARLRSNGMQNDLKPLLINNRGLCEMHGIDLNPQGSFGKRRFNL